MGDVGSHSKPELLSLLIQIVHLKSTDFFIFPSCWARKQIMHKDNNFKIIKNAPLGIFYKHRNKLLDTNKDTIKIVTHHWSNNEKKGFAIYEKLGNYLFENKNKIGNTNFEFTYIGRYSNKFSNNGIRVIQPVDAETLSILLPKYDIYLTASEEEAGANHVLEAMAAGLPVIHFSNGGSINEYCKGMGPAYDDFNCLTGILNSIKEIEKYKSEVDKYCENIDGVIKNYLKIINDQNGK